MNACSKVHCHMQTLRFPLNLQAVFFQAPLWGAFLILHPNIYCLHPIPLWAPIISADVRRMNETESPWLHPINIWGIEAGNITEKSIVLLFTLSTFAESVILLSTLITPLIVLARTGQNVARNITNTETERNVGETIFSTNTYNASLVIWWNYNYFYTKYTLLL